MQQSRMTKPHARHARPILFLIKDTLRRLAMARFGNLRALLFSFVSLLALAITTSAQTPNPTPQVVMPTQEQPVRVAGQSSLYCAGYIKYQPVPLMPEIVGAEEEQEQRKFSQGDIV